MFAFGELQFVDSEKRISILAMSQKHETAQDEWASE